MNSRSVITLATLVVVVLIAAVWTSTSRQAQIEQRGLLYPDLKSQLDQVNAVRVFGPGNQLKVEITRAQDGWRVNERWKYPAAADKVSQLLLDLGEAKTVEEKTSNESNYSALGVEGVSNDTATGVRVELAGIPGIDVIIGKMGPTTSSRYVRKSSEKASWLVDRTLDAPSEPKEWLDTQLIDIAAERIQSVSIAHEGKQAFTAAKANRSAENFTVTGLKKGQALSSDSAANGLASNLIKLELEDVAPFSDWEGKRPQVKATYKTFDGLVIELSGWEADEARHIHARVRYDEQQAKQFGPKESEEKEGKEDKKDEEKKDSQSTKDPRTEATDLDARLQSWVFQIADYKYDSIFEQLDDLLKQ
jgi:hypothetical protein